MKQAFKILQDENFEVSKIDGSTLSIDHGNGKTETLVFTRSGICTEWFLNGEEAGSEAFSDVWEYVAHR